MKIFRNKKIFIIGLIIVALIGIGWFLTKPLRTNAKESSDKKNTYSVRRDTLIRTLTISGEIDADEKVTLRFQSSGMLSWVGVKVGDTVSKYQAIASLDKREIEKRLKKYLLAYSKTRWDFETSKDSYRQASYWGLTQIQRQSADRSFEKAQFDLDSSVLDVELQDISLQFATLTSPISGIVTAVDSPLAGVHITPAQAGFDIINPKTLYLSVLADQSEVTNLSVGMTADLTLDPFSDQTIQGQIQTISYTPKAGESGTVYEVKIGIPNITFYDKIRLGMTGDATFVMKQKKNVIIVPLSFIKTDEDKKYVMKKSPSGTKRQDIKIGEETDLDAEITEGLVEGDVIYD